MKKFLFSACLLFGGFYAQASTLQDFLKQSGTQEKYDKLTPEQKETFEVFWDKIDELCGHTKESFMQLLQSDAREIFKLLFDGAQDPQISLQLSLQIEDAAAKGEDKK